MGKQLNIETIGYGVVKASLKVKNTIYTGEAYCHPEDEFSESLGAQIAESRANLQYLRARRSKLQIEYNTLIHFFNGLQNTRDFEYDVNSQMYHVLLNNIKGKKKELDQLNETIALIKAAPQKLEANFIATRDKIRKVHEKNQAKNANG